MDLVLALVLLLAYATTLNGNPIYMADNPNVMVLNPTTIAKNPSVMTHNPTVPARNTNTMTKSYCPG